MSNPLRILEEHRLDIEQGFVALVEPVADGTLKVRLGRQQMGFDLQRFVAVRDGPNLRQSFDAAWVDDHRVMHGVTPEEPIDPVQPGFRDVLVVTFRRDDSAT